MTVLDGNLNLVEGDLLVKEIMKNKSLNVIKRIYYWRKLHE